MPENYTLCNRKLFGYGVRISKQAIIREDIGNGHILTKSWYI